MDAQSYLDHHRSEGTLVDIRNAVVFITGANRGIGLAFAREALSRGASKVYAGARDPASVTLPGVVPVKLDVNRSDDIAAAARQCTDVTLLINNAGIALPGGFMTVDSESAARAMLETNYFGPMRMTQAFAAALAANGGGAILNVLSVASWIGAPTLGAYASSKAAAWGLTNALRTELRAQSTQVVGFHVSIVDTDATRGVNARKSAPETVVRIALDGVQAGALEVLGDDLTRQVHQGLASDPAVYLYPRAAWSAPS